MLWYSNREKTEIGKGLIGKDESLLLSISFVPY